AGDGCFLEVELHAGRDAYSADPDPDMRGAVQGLDDGVGVAHGAVSLLLASRSAASAFKRAASSVQTRMASSSLRSRFPRVALKSRMAASAAARAVWGFITPPPPHDPPHPANVESSPADRASCRAGGRECRQGCSPAPACQAGSRWR